MLIPSSIEQTLQQLRQLTQQDIQPQWWLSTEACLKTVSATPASGELLAPLNEKGYIVWAKGHQIQWLSQYITIPDQLAGYPLADFTLRVALTWWAEDAQIYVNGQLKQTGDLFDSSTRLVLTQSAKPGETIHLALRLVSPGHDIGGLMRSRLIYERDYPELDPGFIADEWEVLAKYLTAFEPEKLPDLINLLASIPWEIVGDRPAFDQHLVKLRDTLKPLAKSLKKRKFYLLGHAHLDMAWLWPLAETWEAGERTFRSVLNLQQEFPELTFGHTSPLLYAWIEEHQPALFQQIQQAVKNHHWELLGGMWIEPDVNLIAGESIVRQLLYGQRYFQEKFQQISKVAWLPDSFGFCFQLPQLLSQAGIEYFVTGKLHWNDTTKFPLGAFWWESPDGTRLMTVLSPPNVAGVMDTNPITMANYGVQWEQQTGLQDIFWLPGVGDHGGGPTRDMLTVKQRWQASDFFPEIISTTALNYLEKVKKTLLQQPELIPVWQADLYLELHRGYYTTHADQKRANRQAEKSLYTAELWSSIASLVDHFPYPQSALETAWKQTLLNQFHDILPGTSIPEVFTEANQDWQAVHSLTENLIQQALTAITGQVNTGQPPVKNAQPLMIFNALNGSRSEVVILSLGAGQVYDTKGQEILTQKTFDGQCCFLAENIPSIGYQLYWFVPQGQDLTQSVIIEPIAETILENDDVRGVIDPQTGDIASFYDKHQQREIFRQPGNQLQFFTDQGQYWDAWNIDPSYQDYPLPSAQLESLIWLEQGPIRWCLRVIKVWQNSHFIQDYILDIHSPVLKIQTQVNWQEDHVLVKTAFPFNLSSEAIAYEVACGVMEKPTRPQTESEKAQWEIAAHHWADLTDTTQNYGVSLLNDCKYGYDYQPQQLRLSLLRSPKWPDPHCDRGEHHFRYGLYPHTGNWQTAQTVRQGHQFNVPLRVIYPEIHPGQYGDRHSFLDLGSENLSLMAFKRQEDHPQGWILRCYEYQGQKTALNLQTSLPLTLQSSTNLLEEVRPLNVTITPWKIASFQLLIDPP